VIRNRLWLSGDQKPKPGNRKPFFGGSETGRFRYTCLINRLRLDFGPLTLFLTQIFNTPGLWINPADNSLRKSATHPSQWTARNNAFASLTNHEKARGR
jgi:hypothetical protein